MGTLANKRVLLGVTGSIAAYKAAELVRGLRAAGADVRVVMTAGASQFITPLTLQALSGHPVRCQLMDAEGEAAMGHIELARWADVVLVAPASADFLARLAQGRADDLLAALCLAAQVPLAVAPAMNQAMWTNTATRANCRMLTDRGVLLFGPAQGEQACGETGPGRMLEAQVLTERLGQVFATGALAGLCLLVTAGPTREAIDPVRFVSNRSSGKMGYAVAAAAAEAGALVTLISGPVALSTPERVERVDVETAAQMYAAVMDRVAEADLFIATAAVADYRPRHAVDRKIKKSAEVLQLELEQTSDILGAVAKLPRPPFIVGFAAETEQLREHAEVKLEGKGLDMICANLVGPGLGFDSDDNALEVLWQDGSRSLPRASKQALARSLISLIAERYHANRTTKNS